MAKLYTDFFEGQANHECLKWAIIALLAKQDTPESILNFRSINLINSSNKIISKILTKKLSLVINELIDDSQSVFIRARCIVVNIFVAQKLIFNMQKWKLGHVLKVNFMKDFDTLELDFLFVILAARGFRPIKFAASPVSLVQQKLASLLMGNYTDIFSPNMAFTKISPFIPKLL